MRTKTNKEARKLRVKRKVDDGDEVNDLGLRKRKFPKMKKVVLIVLSPRKPKDWDALMSEYNESKKVVIMWVQGSPNQFQDLERCSFRLARNLVIGDTDRDS
jgi:hypothetical protein